MTTFWHSLQHLIGSWWSHHPTTWEGWAFSTYMLTITVGLFMVVFGKKLYTTVLFIAGLAAIVTGVGAATDRDAFRFWGWLLIGVIMLSRPIREYRAHRKIAKAKKIKPKAVKPV